MCQMRLPVITYTAEEELGDFVGKVVKGEGVHHAKNDVKCSTRVFRRGVRQYGQSSVLGSDSHR